MNKRNTLLIGSDTDSSRVALRDLFHDYYHLLEANSAEQALLLLQQNTSIISCVLLDIDHEWAKTYQLLKTVSASSEQAEIPAIVLVSPDISEEEFVKLDTCADDVIRKPCPDRVLMRRVRSFTDLYQERTVLQNKLREKSRLLQHSSDQMIDALSNIIEQRSLESGQHIQRIRGFTRILLEEIANSWPEYGLDQKKISMMSSAAALHDIGKISIPDAILNKPGYLTKDEFETMQAHTVNGCQILEQLKGVANEEYLLYAYNICRYHHERWDGRGYPDGLRKDQIPICAQAAGIADVYDALTTDRVYKAAYHSNRAATMILNGECGIFSPKVLESFKACFPRFAELEHYYKNNAIYEYDADKSVISNSDVMIGESAADRLQAKHRALISYQNATVLEADLVTDIFHLIYNPNPDYRVPENTKSFHSFAYQVANEQIHPDDRKRYLEELQHCHGALFDLGQRRHSVYARMKGAATGKYRPYEFSTIRIDSDDPDARDVLLICRPLDDHKPSGASPSQRSWLEENPQIQAAFLSSLLFVQHDSSLSIVGAVGVLRELSGYTEQEISEQFQGSLMLLVHPEDRDNLEKNIKEQLSVGIVINVDFRIPAKNGQNVWILGKFYLYTDSNGEEYFCALLQNNSKSHTELEHLRSAAAYKDTFLRQREDTLMTILNNQDIWAYVIDQDYCIQFLNKKIRAFVPSGRERQRCYEVFMRRDSPCPNCPAANIRETITASAEFENTYLNLRLRSTATSIRWEGRDAVLLRCISVKNISWPETAPKPNPFKTILHPDVLRHTGRIDQNDPEIMMAALQTLMDHLPGMIFVKDLDLTYRASNQAFAEMTGKTSAQEVIGRTDSEIFKDCKLVQRYTSDDRKLLSGGKNLIDYVEPSTDENGEARYNTTSKYILTGKSGSPVGLLGLSRDITKEMRSRYRYEKEVDYLFALPRDVFVARLIDIDDWRIIGQRAKSINGIELPDYDSIEHMLEDIKRGLQDESAKDTLYFYEEFSPIQLRNLHNSGRSQVEMEHIFHFRNGASLWVRNEIKFLTNPSDGHRCIMSVVRDIDSTRKSADEMVKAATTDALTGVLSRGAGIKGIEEYLAAEGRDGIHAMFMIDVDNFKSVNDLFGHPVGDKLLCDMADAISSCFRDSDFIIRIGGDEFLVFVKNIPTYSAVQKKAEKLLQTVRKVRPADTEALISTSVGISLYPEDGTTQEALFIKADQALYRAKKFGKNQAAFASDENVLFDGGNVAMRYEDYNSFAADHTGIYSYISDIETRELLHMNHAAMTAHGIASPEGYQGRKCYEVLHGRSTPCPHCSNDRLQEGKPYRWKRQNEVLGKTYNVTAMKVHINGRWCRLANSQECEDDAENPDS